MILPSATDYPSWRDLLTFARGPTDGLSRHPTRRESVRDAASHSLLQKGFSGEVEADRESNTEVGANLMLLQYYASSVFLSIKDSRELRRFFEEKRGGNGGSKTFAVAPIQGPSRVA